MPKTVAPLRQEELQELCRGAANGDFIHLAAPEAPVEVPVEVPVLPVAPAPLPLTTLVPAPVPMPVGPVRPVSVAWTGRRGRVSQVFWQYRWSPGTRSEYISRDPS